MLLRLPYRVLRAPPPKRSCVFGFPVADSLPHVAPHAFAANADLDLGVHRANGAGGGDEERYFPTVRYGLELSHTPLGGRPSGPGRAVFTRVQDHARNSLMLAYKALRA